TWFEQDLQDLKGLEGALSSRAAHKNPSNLLKSFQSCSNIFRQAGLKNKKGSEELGAPFPRLPKSF
ncbi:MAG TPA: hypothetical protein PLO67_18305, partial [Saprospiraceae bacterium]|nr:hypothetical protein [Saprospiraceae bacterium]HPI08392.1 hypothetical protein [Saprospiraceae bacterium]